MSNGFIDEELVSSLFQSIKTLELFSECDKITNELKVKLENLFINVKEINGCKKYKKFKYYSNGLFRDSQNNNYCFNAIELTPWQETKPYNIPNEESKINRKNIEEYLKQIVAISPFQTEQVLIVQNSKSKTQVRIKNLGLADIVKKIDTMDSKDICNAFSKIRNNIEPISYNRYETTIENEIVNYFKEEVVENIINTINKLSISTGTKALMGYLSQNRNIELIFHGINLKSNMVTMPSFYSRVDSKENKEALFKYLNDRLKNDNNKEDILNNINKMIEKNPKALNEDVYAEYSKYMLLRLYYNIYYAKDIFFRECAIKTGLIEEGYLPTFNYNYKELIIDT